MSANASRSQPTCASVSTITIGGVQCAGLSPVSVGRQHQIASHSWRASSPLRQGLGFRYTPLLDHLFRRAAIIRTPLSPKNSIPCFSNVTLIELRFRTCMGGLPSTFSARAIAECDTPHRPASSRADHLRKARAARSCAPVIAGFKSKISQQ